MRVGYAEQEIVPAKNLTLSGFVSRCNRPSEGVHDPIFVRVLVVDHGDKQVFIFTYDLLAIGEPLLRKLETAVASSGVDPSCCVFCCTHTHSAPAGILLLGSGIEDETYWNQLASWTQEACTKAVSSLVPARIASAEIDLPGQNFNRRIVLRDNRIVLKTYPGDDVVRTGPAWDRFQFIRFESTVDDTTVVGIVHWAAHPTTSATPQISGDFPGLLSRRLAEREGFPFIYLQGAAGDLSVPVTDMKHGDTKRAVENIMRALPKINWTHRDEATKLRMLTRRVMLQYQEMPSDSELERTAKGMDEIARTGSGDADSVFILSNILNIRRGQEPSSEVLSHTAGVLRAWALRAQSDRSRRDAGCPLNITVLQIGFLKCAFVAGEVFIETAISLREKFGEVPLLIAGYSAPLVGYLPTDDALDEGGYEAEHAYRFFGHPAAFAKGTESHIINEISDMLAELK